MVCGRPRATSKNKLINKCLEPSSNYLSPIGVRSLFHGVPHIECGYPHVATVAVAWGGVVTMRGLGVRYGVPSRPPMPPNGHTPLSPRWCYCASTGSLTP